MSRGSDANGDAALGSAEDAADGDGDTADGDGAREEDTAAACVSVAEAASGSVAEAASASTSSGSEDVGASELEELPGLVSATESLYYRTVARGFIRRGRCGWACRGA